jgi:hypothetical protein
MQIASVKRKIFLRSSNRKTQGNVVITFIAV